MSWALRKLSELSTTFITACPCRVWRLDRAASDRSAMTQLCQFGSDRPVPTRSRHERADDPGDDVETEADCNNQHAWLDARELEAQQQTAVRCEHRHNDRHCGHDHRIDAQALSSSRRRYGEAEDEQGADDLGGKRDCDRQYEQE